MQLRSFIWAVLLFSTSALCALTIADLTPCGLSCLVENIPRVGCSLTDSACQCKSRELSQASTLCLLQNCTMHDSLVVSKVQASTCNLPSEDESDFVLRVACALFVLSALFVIIRICTKGWLSGTLGVDDWVITLASITLIPVMYFLVTMCNQGFGKHLWDLKEGDLLQILRGFYIAEVMYVAILGMVKVSILLFYLTIFPHKVFRLVVQLAIAFIVVSTTVLTLLTIFQCKPVAYFWNRDLRGSCMDINALAYANSAMSIVQDVIIVILPIPILSKLQLGRKNKAGVILMFMVGGFGCIVSMIRLQSLVVFGNSIDPTWDYRRAVLWTGVELGAAVTCACFPAVRRLLVRLYPKQLGSTDRKTSYAQQPSKSWRTPLSHKNQASSIGDHSFVELHNVHTQGTTFPLDTQPLEYRRDGQPQDRDVNGKHGTTLKTSWYDSG